MSSPLPIHGLDRMSNAFTGKHPPFVDCSGRATIQGPEGVAILFRQGIDFPRIGDSESALVGASLVIASMADTSLPWSAYICSLVRAEPQHHARATHVLSWNACAIGWTPDANEAAAFLRGAPGPRILEQIPSHRVLDLNVQPPHPVPMQVRDLVAMNALTAIVTDAVIGRIRLLPSAPMDRRVLHAHWFDVALRGLNEAVYRLQGTGYVS